MERIEAMDEEFEYGTNPTNNHKTTAPLEGELGDRPNTTMRASYKPADHPEG
ncbi:MAG: hypothetical protein ACQETE_16035 [Bacteroidota bacterium]